MKSFLADPLGWIKSQLTDTALASSSQLFPRLEQRAGYSHKEVAEMMADRDQAPEVLLIPHIRGTQYHGMLHFPAAPHAPAHSFSTTGRLNPKMVTLPSGVNLWDHGGYFISTVGVNTSEGCLMNSDGCGPRAVLHALGAPMDYEPLAERLQSHHNSLGADMPNRYKSHNHIGSNLKEVNEVVEKYFGIPGINHIRTFYPRNKHEDSRFAQALWRPANMSNIQEGFNAAKASSGAMMIIPRNNGRTEHFSHAIGFYDGKQVVTEVGDRFTPRGVHAVLEVLTP